jgi:hypothetical protein
VGDVGAHPVFGHPIFWNRDIGSLGAENIRVQRTPDVVTIVKRHLLSKFVKGSGATILVAAYVALKRSGVRKSGIRDRALVQPTVYRNISDVWSKQTTSEDSFSF